MVPQTKLRKPPLRQSDIDAPLPQEPRRTASWREAWEYLDGQPGGAWTVIGLLILFALVTTGIYFLWHFALTLKG
jgi:hypothetical protein